MIKERKNVSDYIYDTIKSDFLNGELDFGDRIVEIDYSKKLEVSRTPLREAIKKLEIEGILERLPNGRLKVLDMTKDKITEIFQIRIALENLLLQSLSKDENILAKMETSLFHTREALERKDWDSARMYFSQFNKLFYEESSLEFTIKILKSYDLILSKLRKNSLSDPKRMILAYEEHKNLLEALLSGDLESAYTINKVHLENSMSSILEMESTLEVFSGN